MIQYLMKRIKAKVEKRQEMFNKDLGKTKEHLLYNEWLFLLLCDLI